MKLLLIGEPNTDLGAVLESCGATVVCLPQEAAIRTELAPFGAFCVFGGGGFLDPRLRVRLEREVKEKGKRLFAEALGSWDGVYCAPPADTVTRRLVCVGDGVPGLSVGDLLDDGANRAVFPYYEIPGMRALLVYGEHIPAHSRWNAPPEELRKNASPGLWSLGETVLASSFILHNFVRARFSPRETWKTLVSFIARWLTGRAPAGFPPPPVSYGADEDLSDDAVFERCRKNAVERGVKWLRRFLVDEGRGGIREGMRHGISPEGAQETADAVRTDCCGEAAGAFRFCSALSGSEEAGRIADDLFSFVFGPMQVEGGPMDGMLRWTDSGWCVCYQDDVARAVLPALYGCLFLGKKDEFPAVCRALDFLVKTTARDGCRNPRTDAPFLDEEKILALSQAEHGLPSAHYNAYYHAALLLAYRIGGNRTYYEVARRGLETIMSLYPETRREQSETEEQCRLILPLAVLYLVSGEEKHREMLYRVTSDLEQRRHPNGGFREWDTGYKAACARTAAGECSLLTENGDPVADLLYSVNWLPLGFAFAYHATGDPRFSALWRETAVFCLKSQVFSADPKTDGSWCRAFDLDRWEAYANPHDAGWAAKCSESGWTNAEILMGLMLPDILKRTAHPG